MEKRSELNKNKVEALTQESLLKDKNSKDIIEKLKVHDKDTGSTALQIYFLTKHIELMNKHFSKNKKDFSVQRAIRVTLSKRNKLCKYFKKIFPISKYEEVVIGIIGLRK